MRQKEIEEVFEELKFEDKDKRTVAKILTKVINYSIKGRIERIEDDISKLTEIINEHYKNIKLPADIKKIQEYIFKYKNLLEPKYIKYILATLALVEKSPWQESDVRFLFHRIYPISPEFEMYCITLIKGTKRASSFWDFFTQRVYDAKAYIGISNKLKQLNQRADDLEKRIEKSKLELIAILSIFAVIMSFIIRNVQSSLELPSIFAFSGVLFLFVILLKFISTYENRWWQWLIILAACISLIGLGIFYSHFF